MWSALNGTIANVITVLVGSTIGLTVGGRLAEKYRSIVLQCLGLVTLGLGVDSAVLQFGKTASTYAPLCRDSATYGARLALVMVACLLVGAVLGTWLRIEQRIESLGAGIHRRFSGQGAHQFAEGFLFASVLFCVGPLTLLGCIRNGAQGDPSFLYVKATLDGFSSMALAAALGGGVLASVLTVAVLQGGLAIAAWQAGNVLGGLPLDLMTIVGGFVLLATGLVLLDIKKIPVANLLPAIILPPVALRVAEWLAPGSLLPPA